MERREEIHSLQQTSEGEEPCLSLFFFPFPSAAVPPPQWYCFSLLFLVYVLSSPILSAHAAPSEHARPVGTMVEFDLMAGDKEWQLILPESFFQYRPSLGGVAPAGTPLEIRFHNDDMALSEAEAAQRGGGGSEKNEKSDGGSGENDDGSVKGGGGSGGSEEESRGGGGGSGGSDGGSRGGSGASGESGEGGGRSGGSDGSNGSLARKTESYSKVGESKVSFFRFTF